MQGACTAFAAGHTRHAHSALALVVVRSRSQAFFYRWWRQQTPERQALVRGFVKSGQLEFIGGG